MSLLLPFDSTEDITATGRGAPQARVWLLGSGSSGNACYVESGSHAFLIDCGLPPLTLRRRLKEIGREIGQIAHIFLTHEHADHAGGIPKLMEKYGHLSAYATKGTGKAIHRDNPVERLRPMRAGDTVEFGPFKITPVPVPHDASEPVCFKVETGPKESGGTSFGYMTDLGRTTDLMLEQFRDVKTLICEANHDLKTLWNGPYPHFLKQRVSSDTGHLNNDQCAAFVSRIAEQGRLNRVVLAHLSEVNNTPDLARAAVRAELDACGAETVSVACARRKEVTEAIELF